MPARCEPRNGRKPDIGPGFSRAALVRSRAGALLLQGAARVQRDVSSNGVGDERVCVQRGVSHGAAPWLRHDPVLALLQEADEFSAAGRRREPKA